MTGRDLIIYILENNLENEQIFKDGKLIGFMTVAEAAAKFGVGEATIYVWIGMNIIPGIQIEEGIYIPVNAKKGVDIK